MNADYVKELEKRCEELQDVVSTFQPTTLNMITWMIDAKREQLHKSKVRWGHNGLPNMMLLREVCTVAVNFGRQCGHSTALEALRARDPLYHVMVAPSRAMTINNRNCMNLDTFGQDSSSLNAKLILADAFLIGEQRYIDKLYTTLMSRLIINNGTPPVVVIT
jgi:hypothetical protein